MLNNLYLFNMDLQLFIHLILIHFLADFGLQTHEQATLKSTSNKFLAYHVGVYSLVWLIANISILGWHTITFAVITFVAHFITDRFTSRIVKPFFAKQDYHNAFVGIGFDQVLHYVQLFLTFKLFL